MSNHGLIDPWATPFSHRPLGWLNGLRQRRTEVLAKARTKARTKKEKVECADGPSKARKRRSKKSDLQPTQEEFLARLSPEQRAIFTAALEAKMK